VYGTVMIRSVPRFKDKNMHQMDGSHELRTSVLGLM
jgi:hypothetical protein